ncbi:MAG: XTP/dITP diphosphatase [Planctomycetes bacterium]|nr:XTP/dITP diphosphatase [Planctomycetota bacterium]
MTREIVIASRNKGKIVEIRQILADLPVKLTSLHDYATAPDVVEDGATYAENARKKAVVIARALGRWTLADDSGLEVDALGGRPGMRSARYSGPKATDASNNEKLLRELASVPDEGRGARYRAVVVLVDERGDILVEAEGTCEGMIGREYRGTAGFGYDPLFLVPEFGRTMAELGLEIKNKISHRARALFRLREGLLGLEDAENPEKTSNDPR